MCSKRNFKHGKKTVVVVLVGERAEGPEVGLGEEDLSVEGVERRREGEGKGGGRGGEARRSRWRRRWWREVRGGGRGWGKGGREIVLVRYC